MLTIIYPYRDREIQRLANSLESLNIQKVKNFEAVVVDYGSEPEMSDSVKHLCNQYEFVTYKYCYVRFQPWNKSKALNSVIRELSTDFCFISDVDIIYHPDFIEKALECSNSAKVIYFQVGFLSSEQRKEILEFHSFKNFRKSSPDATGLSLFPVGPLKKLRGFDEFYHFWGAEDTDMHVRFQNTGVEINFYDQQILLIHQWHPSYRSKEKSLLTVELQITGIIQINQQHLINASVKNKTVVNGERWGNCQAHNEYKALEMAPLNFKINNEKRVIDQFIFGELPRIKNTIIKFKISSDPDKDSVKHKIKQIIGKKVPQYYSLKEINDKVLLLLISLFRDSPYYYRVNDTLDEIEVAIKL